MAQTSANKSLQLLEQKQFLTQEDWVTERTFRHWFTQDVEGFRTKCVVTIARKIYVDLAAFAVWLEAHRGLKGR